MKLVLQCQFDPPIEHPVPKINKIAMTYEKHSFGTKPQHEYLLYYIYSHST
jgi:hypothetical protein